MNLISEVARLKKLDARAEPKWRKGKDGNIYCKKSDKYPLLMPYGINSNSVEGQLIADLRNVAPAMLEALGMIREGDVKKLDALVEMIDFSMPSELTGVEEGDEMFDCAPGEYQEMIVGKGVLRRMQAMCAKMEASK